MIQKHRATSITSLRWPTNRSNRKNPAPPDLPQVSADAGSVRSLMWRNTSPIPPTTKALHVVFAGSSICSRVPAPHFPSKPKPNRVPRKNPGDPNRIAGDAVLGDTAEAASRHNGNSVPPVMIPSRAAANRAGGAAAEEGDATADAPPRPSLPALVPTAARRLREHPNLRQSLRLLLRRHRHLLWRHPLLENNLLF